MKRILAFIVVVINCAFTSMSYAEINRYYSYSFTESKNPTWLKFICNNQSKKSKLYLRLLNINTKEQKSSNQLGEIECSNSAPSTFQLGFSETLTLNYKLMDEKGNSKCDGKISTTSAQKTFMQLYILETNNKIQCSSNL